MKSAQAKSAAAIAGLAVLAAVVGIRGQMRSDPVEAERDTTPTRSVRANAPSFNSLLQPVQHRKEAMGYKNEAERIALLARNKRFVQLWLERHERDITAEMAAFLEDPDSSIRESAAIALGRLDSDEAARVLEEKLQRQQVETRERWQQKQQKLKELRRGVLPTGEGTLSNTDVPELTLRLALGRAKSRNLKGQQRLQEVLGSIGLTLDGLKEVLRRRRESGADTYQSGDPAGLMVAEVVDLLYTMKRKGENIESIRQKWIDVPSSLEVKLDGAGLPLQQEAKAAVDYAERPGSSNYVEGYLYELGPAGTDALIHRLQEIEQSPQKDQDNWGHVEMFRAAAPMKDPRIVPLLEKFTQSKDPRVRHYSSQTLEDIRDDGVIPRVPA